jgi:hypothetical protein
MKRIRINPARKKMIVTNSRLFRCASGKRLPAGAFALAGCLPFLFFAFFFFALFPFLVFFDKHHFFHLAIE